MLASPPILQDDDPPPLFGPNSSLSAARSCPATRPSFVDASSDDSVMTMSSSSTTSTTSIDLMDVSELALSLNRLDAPDVRQPNLTTPSNHVNAIEHDPQQSTTWSDNTRHVVSAKSRSTTMSPPLEPPRASSVARRSSPPCSNRAWRTQTLPELITDSERALRNIRTSAPSAILGNAVMSPTTTTTPSTVSPVTSTMTTATTEPSQLARSGSTSSSIGPTHSTRIPSPTTNTRPGSSGSGHYSSTTSGTSTSTRPWVRDSDSSSVCSAASSCCSSTKGETTSFGEHEHDQAPQVFKPIDDGLEFLDPRPEPPGVKLSIHRDDLKHVIIKVQLPGFSVENITVAMRRGHKVHIVADSYGEQGGHFEKLVSLGTDVSSAAPRAEFNGSELNVFIKRRTSLNTSSSTMTSPPMSPSLSVASPTLSLTSTSSPRLDHYFDNIYDQEEAPVVSRSTAESDMSSSVTSSSSSSSSFFFGQPGHNSNRSSKSLTGPEGARAAAKAAREEAAKRAKEAAKSLSCGSCKFPFKRETNNKVVSNTHVERGFDTHESSSGVDEGLNVPARSGTIKARTPSPSLTSATDMSSTPTVTSTSGDTTPHSSIATRPKFRSSNLTLKATDRTSFLDAVLKSVENVKDESTLSIDSCSSPGSQEGSTPRVERHGMEF
ncbi:hypothetical protein OIO90_005201 [Microbotryomycetes sp. JL221]|nr:hypothetical protein OIO90_005201 [Microbotryomycetes sp. JL221]